MRKKSSFTFNEFSKFKGELTAIKNPWEPEAERKLLFFPNNSFHREESVSFAKGLRVGPCGSGVFLEDCCALRLPPVSRCLSALTPFSTPATLCPLVV